MKCTPLFFLAICLAACKQVHPPAIPEIAFDITKSYPADSGTIYLRQGDSIKPMTVKYLKIGDKKIFQGDILISPATNHGALKANDLVTIQSYSITTAGNLWPGGIIPYEIDPALTDSQKYYVQAAIAYWMANTGLVFGQHQDEPNYVHFFPNQEGPSSSVGMQGGEQLINISSGTSLGNIKHEIGHTIGLWHEQCRSDRDNYILVDYDNIIPDAKSQFDIQPFGNINSDYDYNSIMHYGPYFFAVDRTKPTITPLNPAPAMGQRDSLSVKDIAGIKLIYPPS